MDILWLKGDLLHPVDKGGKIRTYQMLRQLRRDHKVTFLTLANRDDPPEALGLAHEYCDRLVSVPYEEPRKFSPRFYRDLLLNLSSPLPYALEKYQSEAMRREISREMREHHYDVIVCDFLVPSVNIPEPNDWTTVLFQHNVESMIWRRHFETQSHRLKKTYLYNQWRKMDRYERAACHRFDAVVAVSEADRDLMREEFGLREVYDVPTGVDTEFFRPAGAAVNPRELVFTGSMDWMPNEDGMLYFVEKILPIVRRSMPDVELTVVGRNPTRQLVAMAEADPRIKVTGRVDDIRPYLDRAAASIVPLRVGGGTRLKIYEAMAMARPVISTTVGAEGLPLSDGEEIFIADAPEEFAERVVRVLSDEALASRMGARGREVVCSRFGWDRAADRFSEICERVVRNNSRKRAA
ncbi:MAG TPA: glycosyltransferase [Blastocatellia bacterium]|nr:glycosyltransferase [Blastocatellia bacterium]